MTGVISFEITSHIEKEFFRKLKGVLCDSSKTYANLLTHPLTQQSPDLYLLIVYTGCPNKKEAGTNMHITLKLDN